MSSSLSRFSGWRSRSLSLGEGLPDSTGARDGTRADGVLDRGRRRLFSFWRYCPAAPSSYRVDRGRHLGCRPSVGSPACFLSGIFGWRDRGLYPLAGGSRMNLARSLGGAADFCLTSFEVGGFGAGANLWGQLPHDPIATAGCGGLRRAFSLAFSAGGIAVFIHWRVAAEFSNNRKQGDR